LNRQETSRNGPSRLPVSICERGARDDLLRFEMCGQSRELAETQIQLAFILEELCPPALDQRRMANTGE
jgi:hypothetical protein